MTEPVDPLAALDYELDIEAITVTCDADGVIHYNAGEMTWERAKWLLDSASFLLLHRHWINPEEADDDERREDDDE